jgi:hypothetical protein
MEPQCRAIAYDANNSDCTLDTGVQIFDKVVVDRDGFKQTYTCTDTMATAACFLWQDGEPVIYSRVSKLYRDPKELHNILFKYKLLYTVAEAEHNDVKSLTEYIKR